MALEMLAEFQTLIFLQYHAATPMLLGGERVAFRMLEFSLIAKVTATLEEQGELTDYADFGIRFASMRSAYNVGGQFIDTQD